MGKMSSALKLAVCAVTVLTLCAQTVHGVSYVVGNQDSGYTGMFIGQYNEWLVGNPRRLSYLFGSLDPDTNLGGICSGSWISWAVIGNQAPGNLDFNCQSSVQDISANVNTVGYYVGGLNQNGVTIALCYVAARTNDLCDSDTISNSESRQCTTYLKCE
jgi:hypothetical protein